MFCSLKLISFVLLLVAVCCCCSEESGTCDDLVDSDTNREELFKLFEHSLQAGSGNIYRIRNLLFPPIGVFPELARIMYNFKIINTTNESISELDDKVDCSCQANDTVSITNTTTLQYGWTTIGLYNYIHPAMLNQLQPQLPFIMMRAIAPNNVPFLWDGCNDLPSITIDLSIPLDNLTCVPTMTEVDYALKILTSHLRYYILPERSLVIGQPELEKYHALEESFVNVVCYQNQSMCSIPQMSTRQLTATPIILFFILFAVTSIAYIILLLLLCTLSQLNSLEQLNKPRFSKQLPMVFGFVLAISQLGFFSLIFEPIAVAVWFLRGCSLQIFKIVIATINFLLMLFVMLLVIFIVCYKNKVKLSLYVLIHIPTFIYAVLWLPNMYLAVLIMGFAYPLYISALIAFHIGIIYVFSIAYAFLVTHISDKIPACNINNPAINNPTINDSADNNSADNNSASDNPDPTTNNPTSNNPRICFILVLSIALHIFVTIFYAVLYFGVLWLFGLIAAQGLISSTGAEGAVIFLPSLGIFFAGWLMKTNILWKTADTTSNGSGKNSQSQETNYQTMGTANDDVLY